MWPIARKIGKRKSMLLGMLMSAVGALIGWLQPHNLVVVLISLVIRSFGLLPTYLMASMQADMQDHIEWKNGFRCDGLTGSMISVFATIAMGIGTGLFNLGLGQTGYVPPAADGTVVAQTAAVQNYFVFGYFGVPMLTYLISFALFLTYTVEKDAPQMAADIAARHRAEAEAQGLTYVSPEEKAALEQAENDRKAEENRIAELKAKCAKKGLNFEEEEAKYQAKLAAKLAKTAKRNKK